MLKYLVQLTQDLAAPGLIIGMLFAYMNTVYRKRGRTVLLCASGVSLAASVVMTLLVNTSNAVSKKLNLGYIAYINLYTFLIFAAALLVFAVFSLGVLQKKTKLVGEIVTDVAASLIVFTLVFYKLPSVLAYPFNFDLADNTVFSTDFIYRMWGCVFGFLLVLVMSIAAYQTEKALPLARRKAVLLIAMLVNALNFGGIAIQLMLSRRILRQTHFLFSIVKLTINYSEYFIFAIMLCAVGAGVYLYVKNTKVTEEYSNPAQLRKIKAAMRRQRRWSAVLVVCAVLAVINLTAIDAYNNKEPDEAPVEQCEVVDENVIVPLTAVSDGHLHRFGYTTSDGILVKFIVVQKPGSTAYGVGLDACDICGDAGYYEKDDQIVCRRCDVVMNTNTIGFKGGCNPIVIDYSVENGQIIVPVETLVAHQNEFK